jgi:hypothetical protein
MKTNVVVEGTADVSVLTALLSNEEKANIEMRAAGGRSALPSVARTMLVRQGGKQ